MRSISFIYLFDIVYLHPIHRLQLFDTVLLILNVYFQVHVYSSLGLEKKKNNFATIKNELDSISSLTTTAKWPDQTLDSHWSTLNLISSVDLLIKCTMYITPKTELVKKKNIKRQALSIWNFFMIYQRFINKYFVTRPRTIATLSGFIFLSLYTLK